MALPLKDKRFYRESSFKPTSGGGKIRLKHRELFLSDSMKNATEKIVVDARFKMLTAMARLSMNPLPDDVRAALTRCFKTNAAGDILEIKKILVLISNGINGDVSVKVSSMNTAYLQPGETKADIAGVEGYVRGVGSADVGDIHVSPQFVKNNHRQAVLIFLHEASHRYATTTDFDEQGYMHDDGSNFRQAGITTANCLNNADSYAHFVMATG